MRITVILALLVICPQQARPDFWSHLSKGRPETVKLVRKLPPVAARTGNTVRFVPEIAGKSIPPETATILREKIRTLLLNAKAGGIQLVDGPADTVVKCIVTGYEPKTLHQDQRQAGNQHQQIVTWVGNIEASVQVFDNRGKPIDAANLKHHMENDFVVTQQEEKVAAVNDKRASRWDKLAGAVRTLKGGDAGDVASLAGSGQQMHDALGAGDKGVRQPTDLEWRTALIEGLAAKVANRIVTVDQEFVAILPADKEFVQVRELAKSGRWGDVQERTEKMNQLAGGAEAFRLYMLGLSEEAIACQDADSPDKAAELLNKASKYYDDANKLRPNEREFRLAQIRAQDSLDHYLEIQHYLQTRSKGATTATPTAANPGVSQPATQNSAKTGETPSTENATNNAALIEMAQAGMTEKIMITFVRTAPDPKFDVSANGLLQLGRAKIPPSVIEAVQQRMSSATKPAVRRTSQAPTRKATPAPPPN
jgi:hypothetical protein